MFAPMFRPMIGTMVRSMGGGGAPAFSPAVLFAAGEVGAWYDPSDLATLYQDTTGTSPVTTPGQTVAVMVDKSKPYVSVTSLPTMACSASVTQSGNVLTFNNSLAGDQASGGGISATGFYAMTFTVAGTGSVVGYVGAGLRVFSAGTHTLKTWYAVGVVNFIFRANTGGFNGTVTFTERRDYLGNHATQGTVAARPTYRVDGSGRPYLDFDGTDDFLGTSIDANTLFGRAGTNNPGYLFAIGGLFNNATTVAGSPWANTALFGDQGQYLGFYGKNIAGVASLGWFHWSAASSFVERAFTVGTNFVFAAYRDPSLGASGRNFARVNTGSTADVDVAALNGNATTLMIGRQGTTAYGSGRIYGLIVRGAVTDAAEITSTETWLNGKTGAY